MTTCSLDIVKTLYPAQVKDFRSSLARVNLLEEVLSEEGEGLTLNQFYEALLNTFPSSVLVECLEARHFSSARAFVSSVEDVLESATILVNYLEDLDDPDSGHWAVLLDIVNDRLRLFSPGYHDETRIVVMSVSDFWPRFCAKDPVSKQDRGIILIGEGGAL